jgi:hypothetical protein
MATELRTEIPLEEIRRALSDELGAHYTVTATSDSTLKVKRMPLVTERVQVKWHGDRTTIVVSPGEVWILQGINALTIHRKVRRVVEHDLRARLENAQGPPTVA